MARGMYATIGGESRKAKKACTVVGGAYRKVKKIFVVKDGVYKECWRSSTPAGEIVITTSGTWEVPDGVKKVDIFAVGGGGGAGGEHYLNVYNHSPDYTASAQNTFENYGCNGGYGYTNTLLNCDVTPGETLSVIIGAGGTAGESHLTSAENGNVTYEQGSTTTQGGNGGTTSVLREGVSIISANGGSGGQAATEGSVETDRHGYPGASGGSGSGVSRRLYRYMHWSASSGYDSNYLYSVTRGADGYDGSGGDSGEFYGYDNVANRYLVNYTPTSVGGSGQGSTTRKFGEQSNTLYASRTVTAPNTGTNGRKQGASESSSKGDADNGGGGGAGVVIIRWAEQED